METRSKKFNLLIYQTGKILIYTLAAATFKNEYQEIFTNKQSSYRRFEIMLINLLRDCKA